MRISDWSSDVCSSDLIGFRRGDKRRDLQQDDFMIAGRILRMNRAFEGEGRIADEDGARTRTASIDPLPSFALVLVRELTTKVALRSEEHTSELQSLMRISYAVFCVKKQDE